MNRKLNRVLLLTIVLAGCNTGTGACMQNCMLGGQLCETTINNTPPALVELVLQKRNECVDNVAKSCVEVCAPEREGGE